MLRLRLRLVIVGRQRQHDLRWLLPLPGRLSSIRANTGWDLTRLLQHLLIHDALTLSLLFWRRLLLLGVRVLGAAQLILVLVRQLTIINELAVLLGRLHLQLLRVLLLLML